MNHKSPRTNTDGKLAKTNVYIYKLKDTAIETTKIKHRKKNL